MPAEPRQPPYDYHDNCERRVYVNWINRNLFDKPDIGTYLPINPNCDDIFDRISDGYLYCCTISYIFPNSIDMTIVKIGPDVERKEKIKNLSLAFETARAFGCRVNDLRLDDVFSGVRQSVLELFWQIFKVGLVNMINYEGNPELTILRRGDESDEAMRELKPPEFLMRYVNYRIDKFIPSGPQLTKFDENLNDCVLYIFLIDAIAQDQNLELPNSIEDLLSAGESGEGSRWLLLVENFSVLKIRGFLNEEVLKNFCTTKAAKKMHILTIADIFHKFPLVGPNFPVKASSDYETIENTYEPETNLEKLCRSFLNFLGVKPVCTAIAPDCADSLMLVQAMDKLRPDTFKRAHILRDFKGSQVESKKVHNATVLISRFPPFYSFPLEELYPERIATANRPLIAGIVYNLLLYWAVNGDRSEEDEPLAFDKKELLGWVNAASLTNRWNIRSFRDLQIDQRNILLELLNQKIPGGHIVDWNYYVSLETRLNRSLYFVSLARREGCPMIVHPHTLAMGCHYSMMLTVALLRFRDLKLDLMHLDLTCSK